jgi:RNA polymerase sigma factor (sigma-70 family)
MNNDQVPEGIRQLRERCRVTPRTPEGWLTAIRGGDATALEECDRLLQLGAVRSSRRRQARGWNAFTKEEIEDIVAECRLKLFERVADETFMPNENYFEAYIMTVVFHYTIDIVRQRAQIPEQPLDPLKPQPDVVRLEEPVDPERQRLYTALDGCLGQLNERYQQIVAWYCNEMQRNWIAAQLSPPSTPNAVGVRWNEIRRSLRLCLERAGFTL